MQTLIVILLWFAIVAGTGAVVMILAALMFGRSEPVPPTKKEPKEEL